MPTYPPFVPIASTVTARITAAYQPGPATAMNLMSFFCLHGGPVTSTDTDNVLAMLTSWCDLHYSGTFNADWKIIKIEAFARDDITGPFSSGSMGITGGLLASSARPEWAPLMLLNTGLRGRSHHGRVYTFPCDSLGIGPDNSHYTDAHMSSLATAFDQLRTASNAADVPLAVASEKLAETNIVTGITYSNRYTLQTRRRPGFGT